MSGVIERMARAEHGRHFPGSNWDEVSSEGKAAYRKEARAHVEEMFAAILDSSPTPIVKRP